MIIIKDCRLVGTAFKHEETAQVLTLTATVTRQNNAGIANETCNVTLETDNKDISSQYLVATTRINMAGTTTTKTNGKTPALLIQAPLIPATAPQKVTAHPPNPKTMDALTTVLRYGKDVSERRRRRRRRKRKRDVRKDIRRRRTKRKQPSSISSKTTQNATTTPAPC